MIFSRGCDVNPYIKSAINKLESTQVVHKQRAYKPHSKCPCGSGRKFRKCCMLRLNRGEGLLDKEQALKIRLAKP